MKPAYILEIVNKLNRMYQEPVQFTAEELKTLALDNYPFTEEQLNYIMDREADKEQAEMNTILVDTCADLLLKLYKAEEAEEEVIKQMKNS